MFYFNTDRSTFSHMVEPFKLIKMFLFLCPFLGIAGCDDGLNQAMKKSVAEFEAACKLDAGVYLGEKVYIDGYYDDFSSGNIIWTRLKSENIDFIELSLDADEVRDHSVRIRDRSIFPEMQGKLIKVFTEPGYWRVSRDALGSDQCNVYIQQWMAERNESIETSGSSGEPGCFSVEKIDEIKSQYGYFHSEDTHFFNNENRSKMTRFESVLKSIPEGKIVASFVDYFYRPYPDDGLLYGSNTKCNFSNDVGFPANMISASKR